MARLSVIIPALDEAPRLPLLLADLAAAPLPGTDSEVIVVDGGSRDATPSIARLAGATVLASAPGRGLQLDLGARRSRGDWLWFLHADCRLPPGWAPAVAACLHGDAAQHRAWCFDLAVEGAGWSLRLLELAVGLRTRLLHRPYGDQGLLLPRAFYEEVGGFRPWPLMEDLDLVQRLGRSGRIASLGLPLLCDGRRWRRHGVWRAAWLNHRLRRRWRRGLPPDQLAGLYYGAPARLRSRTRRRSAAAAVPDPSPGARRSPPRQDRRTG
ncbi:glycosyltransferase [Synechococcus sp. RSCCF101]|uniref:TIGR04283 family arsenosugar biosynthesis glycosyltransferase n=1 Tax=Synechococcus sp. RSCCF101 TaxID=2511069 RepID=UPI001246FF02|nr:TIGR04283 family arsenosugar biosynthesis glycosyltransferase [Synechococcus sp. RSCCF101]QEY31318.1 glycosyltransferase [Synechococcus sp. RSCCF101]